MTLGDRLRQLRGQDSQATFGARLKVAQPTIRNYENNERFPDSKFIETVCNEYNVTADWLLFGVGDQKVATVATLQNKQHAEIITSEKIKTGDVASFGELRALDKELRTALRENAELQAKYADLRVERERWVAERERLLHDNEVLRHDNEVLRHELGVYRGTEPSTEYPIQRGAPRTSPPPPDESKEIDASCTCGTASPLQDSPTDHPRK